MIQFLAPLLQTLGGVMGGAAAGGAAGSGIMGAGSSGLSQGAQALGGSGLTGAGKGMFGGSSTPTGLFDLGGPNPRTTPPNDGFLGHGIDPGAGIHTGGVPGTGDSAPYDFGAEEAVQGDPEIPKPPNPYAQGSDVSGFAAYGMTPPSMNVAMKPPALPNPAQSLPNPQNEIGAGAQPRQQGLMDLSQPLQQQNNQVQQQYGQSLMAPLAPMQRAQQAPDSGVKLGNLMALAAIQNKNQKRDQESKKAAIPIGRLQTYLRDLSRS